MIAAGVFLILFIAKQIESVDQGQFLRVLFDIYFDNTGK